MVIPWKKLMKEHVVVTIDEVYIIVGPKFGTQVFGLMSAVYSL